MDSEAELKLQKQIKSLQAQVNALGAELRRLYRVTTHPSARGYIEKLAVLQSTTIDHGALGGLSDDDHLQYVKHSLATAVSDFLVASGAGAFIKKTLAEVKTILGLGSAAYTASTDYVPHSLATAANDFLVASGAGVYIKNTLTEVKTLLGMTDGSVTLAEIAAPGAPGANSLVIYAVDNGGGKTQLMVRFPSGAAQQIAIEL